MSHWAYYSEVARGWCVIDDDFITNGTATQVAFFSNEENATAFIEGVSV